MYQSNEFAFQLSPWDAPWLEDFTLEGDQVIGTVAPSSASLVSIPYGTEGVVLDWTNGHAPVRFRRLYLVTTAFTGSPTLNILARVNGELKIGPVEWLHDVEATGALAPFDLFVPGSARLQVSFQNFADDLSTRAIRIVLMGAVLSKSAKGGP